MVGRGVMITLVALAGALPAGGVGADPASAGERCVTDDAHREVCLDAPAERIIGLSPGVTELLFAAGAGDRVRGAVAHSDYPEAALDVPRLGSHTRIDLERLIATRPDLVVVWTSGNPDGQVEQLAAMGLTLYHSEPRRFADVASTLRRLGRLAGTETVADERAAAFEGDIRRLRQAYSRKAPVRVFYQVWDDPIMTINDSHLIGEAIALCGGVNVFGELERLVPRLDRESVLAAQPEAIVAGGMGEDNPEWLDPWRQFEELPAVRRDNLFFVPPSDIQRPTPRVVSGAERLCEHLETARGRR